MAEHSDSDSIARHDTDFWGDGPWTLRPASTDTRCLKLVALMVQIGQASGKPHSLIGQWVEFQQISRCQPYRVPEIRRETRTESAYEGRRTKSKNLRVREDCAFHSVSAGRSGSNCSSSLESSCTMMRAHNFTRRPIASHGLYAQSNDRDGF